MQTEAQIKKLQEERDIRSAEKPLDFAVVKQYLKYFLEHLEDLLVKQIDPIQKANFFGLLFNGAPNYGEILSANKNSVEPPKLNELFKLKNEDSGIMVHPKGFEPPTFGTGNQRSIQLSYGCILSRQTCSFLDARSGELNSLTPAALFLAAIRNWALQSKHGTPGRTRTCDPLVRSQVL